MSYCVNCGVELDATASFCPLCHTPVLNPGQPVDEHAPKPFPTQRGEVAPASKRELALLITAMLASVAVCCGVLNFFLRTAHTWSLYIVGAAVMLWIWLVLPLLAKKMLDGRSWFCGLALPIILWGGAILLLLGLVLRVYRRSVLTSVTILIGSVGVLLFGVEFFLDRWLSGSWEPSWSVVVLAVCAGLTIPLLVIRRVPSLREEVRRRFHL